MRDNPLLLGSESTVLAAALSARRDGLDRTGKKGPGPAEDVHETSQFPLFPEERTGLEALQIESLEVKQSTRLGIGVEVDLETAIEEEAIHKIGANAPTDGVGCFEDEDFATGFVEEQGGA